MSPSAHPLVFEARDVTKVYPGTTALKGVTFGIRAGEVHALIGENGAGKSTLVKILAGVDLPTRGALSLDGRDVAFSSVRDAASRGVGLIHQELQLFPDLSVAENLFVGRERTTAWGTVDATTHERSARDELARLGQVIDPRALVGSLPLGLQQMVEIARALVADTRVLMMDEPTSALTAAEIAALFAVIRELASRGVAIVYISHHLHELIEIADRVTVLRDGAVVGEAPCRDVSVPWIVERMTGRAPQPPNRRATISSGNVAIEVNGLSLPGAPGRTPIDNVSLHVRRGEVVGIYGLLGSGRTELFESLIGMHRHVTGVIAIDGDSIDGLDVSERVEAGLAMVPEDRQVSGLVPTLNVQKNMTLSSLDALSPLGVISSRAEKQIAAATAEQFRVKAPSLDSPVTSLSGGNQQKVVIARSVMRRPSVLLLDEPTRGVDVAAKAEILNTMRSLAASGMAIAFASSDVAEILEASDRILVMARGRIRAEIAIADATEEGITTAASVAPVGKEGKPDVIQ